MKFLNSEALLDLLVNTRVLTPEQHQFITLEKSKQRQKLLRLAGKEGEGDKSYPDLVDIVSAFHFTLQNNSDRLIDEELIMRVVARDRGIPFKKLDPLDLDMDVTTKTVPRNFAIRQLILPFNMVDGVLEVAMYNPDSGPVLEDIEQANQVKVKPYLSTREDIKRIIAEFFGFQKSISAAEDQFRIGYGGSGAVDIGNLERYVKISSSKEITSSDQHIKSAVNHIFQYALEQRASDIHIEPKRDVSVVRFRIDGALHTIYNLPKAVHSALVSRVKFLSRLDIAEKRRPQDGRIKIGGSSGRDVEIRVSTVPVSFGEKAVMRILDSAMIFQQVENLGFSSRDMEVYNSFITAQHGIILVTGPTGSGKSTTLYSTLKEIATPEKNIVTVEDPVEMVHEEFNQIAVQPLIDVTFSTILRNILRQDPDILMIGEIRDKETAAHAVQAAMTGHLVFSTLHTNDAVSSIARLRDLGLQPFMIASTLLGCMAQRLVKTICPVCVESFVISGVELENLGFPVGGAENLTLKRGKGCRECRGTGYKGRCGVFEIFPMSSQLKKMAASDAHTLEMRQIAIREGMTTLREDAWNKVKRGITTIEEALRVTSER
ncbi:GspE/PulE family protein [Desulforhopalus singaporensis]|uniref:General secretion pathway protein E n=1 Tax=Desulforhopalus singaporensis TaxID=91360 RepID=A0A1H0S9X5_9BACT|nr:GspE/PulE family protein [Desulforhopalus singaporensis]SDP37966.1 general secretion pathway protein E [Desulforhopalus singaporensis]